MRTKGSGLILCIAALAAAPASAQSPPQQVGPQLVLDGVSGVADSQLRDQSCGELKFGTAGDNEPGLPDTPDKGNGLAPGAPSTAPASLPTIVPFKTETESFNRRYWFAVAGGRIWFRSNTLETGIRQPWKELPIPPCFYGRVTQISADDDELLAIDTDRRIYTMNHALEDPSLFDWTSRWGPLFWSGSGHALPSNIQTWAWSVLSIHEDGTYRDSAGNDHPVGEFKVSHVWTLRDNGRRLNFNDPWLARDQSYVMCGPQRDRFRAVDMAASGSTVFVIGRRGDMFTRL